MSIILNNIYYQQDSTINEYKKIFLETSIGVLRIYTTYLEAEKERILQSMNRVNEIDNLKRKYGDLNIEEVRRTYDNDVYLLISGKFLLAIEYNLNSNFNYSNQEFRIIEDITGANKTEFDLFREFDFVKLPLC